MQNCRTRFFGILSGDQHTHFSFILLTGVKVTTVSPPSMLDNTDQANSQCAVSAQKTSVKLGKQENVCRNCGWLAKQIFASLKTERLALFLCTGTIFIPHRKTWVCLKLWYRVYLHNGENSDNPVETGRSFKFSDKPTSGSSTVRGSVCVIWSHIHKNMKALHAWIRRVRLHLAILFRNCWWPRCSPATGGLQGLIPQTPPRNHD